MRQACCLAAFCLLYTLSPRSDHVAGVAQLCLPASNCPFLPSEKPPSLKHYVDVTIIRQQTYHTALLVLLRPLGPCVQADLKHLVYSARNQQSKIAPPDDSDDDASPFLTAEDLDKYLGNQDTSSTATTGKTDTVDCCAGPACRLITSQHNWCVSAVGIACRCKS